MDVRETQCEVARRTLHVSFPGRDRAEQRRAAGERSWGCFVVLPEPLATDVDYEIVVAGIPEGVMAASAWLQEAEDGVPIFGTARFHTDGVALDVRHGSLRLLGRHDFADWPLQAGIMLLLHW